MCLIISSIIIITIIIIFHFYDAPVLIRELKIAWFCVFPINSHRNFPCDMIIPTCSLCQTWANPSAVEFQRIISSVRKSWKRKFCDFLFTFWSHQMGNKSFSNPSKSCSDSKQNNVEGLVGLVKRRLWSLTLKEFKMLEKSQWLVCNTISMLNFFSVKEQFSYFFSYLFLFVG